MANDSSAGKRYVGPAFELNCHLLGVEFQPCRGRNLLVVSTPLLNQLAQAVK